MLPSLRREKIVRLVHEHQMVSVAELAALLDVSPVTIRQDLVLLSQHGLLTRIRGGAAITGRNNHESTFTVREKLNADKKRRIGELAASLVVSGESIILDASTTALYLVRALKKRHDLHEITVVTNGVLNALELLDRPDITTLLTGGILRARAVSLIGSVPEETLSRIHGHRGFFGARGLTVEHGLTDVNLQELQVKMYMVERCQEITAIVDSSKFGQVAVVTFAPIARLHRIITDAEAPADAVAAFRSLGVEVLLA